MNQPLLVISLDFELHWGRFDKYPLEPNLTYYRNTREVIPQLLELFDRFGILATWATVGMLMADNEEEWREYQPKLLPSFEKSKFSAYRWFESEAKKFREGLFAPELVKLILDCPGQELGSHSYAHYFSLEGGQTLDQWSADLKAAKKISMEKFGVQPESLVFPRNQYTDKVIETAGNEGFSVVRTNPSDWFWENVHEENLIKKIFRTGDTLFSAGKKVSYSGDLVKGKPLALPASRLLRPYKPGSLFNSRRIKRIKEELAVSIKLGEIYHLWWHPHNFGNYPKENLRILEDLLEWIKEMKESKGLVSLNMKEVGKKIKKEIII